MVLLAVVSPFSPYGMAMSVLSEPESHQPAVGGVGDFVKLILPPLAGGLLTGLAGGLAVLLGPGRYRGWRIKKLHDLVDTLDAELFAHQRAVLLGEVGRLSTLLAATYKAPTYWPARLAYFTLVGFFAGYVVSFVVFLGSFGSESIVSALAGVVLIGVFFVPVAARLYLWADAERKYTKSQRADFIEAGLPDQYQLPPRPPLPGSRAAWWLDRLLRGNTN